MAWTSPRTWANGTVPGASDLNTEIRDNMTYLLGSRPIGQTIYVAGADYTTSSTTFVDVDAANVVLTITPQSSRIWVAANCTVVPSGAGSDMELDLIVGAVRVGHATHGLLRTNGTTGYPFILGKITGLTPGALQTIKLQWRSLGAWTSTIKANAWPIVLNAWEY